MAYAAKDISVRDITVKVVDWRNLRQVDWMLPLFVLGLAIVGWATLYSAGRGPDAPYHVRQVQLFAVGAVLALFIICTDYRFVVGLGPLMYAGALGLLLAVEFFGASAKGAERWLDIGPVRVQPSEFVKVALVYALAWYFVKLGDRIRSFHWFCLTFILVGIPVLLILRQPNLGTAASLGPLALVMLYVAGCRMRHLMLVILLGLSIVPMVWWQMRDFDPDTPVAASSALELEHYQKRRIYTFLNPEYDIRNTGWHTYQSKITVGSGGLAGKGYLQGTQTRLKYLPEHHTDFIFSLLAEEHGFIGGVVLIGLFAGFLLRGLMFARDCPDMMGTLIATGVVTLLAFHVFVNIAITIGLLPVTGIPLPFLSYGGSFYLTTMIFVGMLLNVPMRRRIYVK